MAKVGVVLSGSGYLDGAEIREATLTLLFLDKHGVESICMAPDKAQARVVNHITGQSSSGSRNVLEEAGRIARGEIRDIKDVSSDELDALILPGGFGAALSLSSFATEEAECSVDNDVERLIADLHTAKKPLGFICIAPSIGAKVLGSYGVTLTIGTDQGTAGALEKMGARHVACEVDDIVVDAQNMVVSTPAYMFDASIASVAKGIEKLVSKVIELL